MTDREMLLFIKKQLEQMHSLFDTLDKEYSLTVCSHEANELFEAFGFLEEDIQTQLNNQLAEFTNRVTQANEEMYEELLIDTYKKLTEIGKRIFEQIGKTVFTIPQKQEVIKNDNNKKTIIRSIKRNRRKA